jgi:CubicO group peptidase (beta-lactamase class C family)
MKHSRHLAALGLAFLPALCAPTARAQGSCTLDLGFVDPLVDAYLAANPGLSGAGVVLHVDGVLVFERYYGSYTPATAIPIASASKWITSAAVLAAQDRGLVELDDTVASYEPLFNAGALADITLRQCVSHTAGLPSSSSAVTNGALTLEQAAAQIASEGPRLNSGGTPVGAGADFCYGGVSMHVGGRVLEIASGLEYRQLLDAWLTGPLGMTQTVFPPQQGDNPWVAGGMRSTPRDYMRFVEMLRSHGMHNGQVVLSAASVDELLRNQTGALPFTCTPQDFEPLTRYGVGCWLDVVDAQGRAIQASSTGALGFTPWIDTQRGICGVFAIQGSAQDVAPTMNAVQEQLRAAVDNCSGVATTTCDGAAAPCPCANFGADGEGCRNSTQRGARALASGSASLTGDDLYLHVRGLPGERSALVFMGTGLVTTPLDSGVRCAGGVLYRFPRQFSSPGGSLFQGPIVSQAAQRFADGGGLAPGVTRYFQTWYRDFPGACGAPSNLSNTLSVTFAP